jgi:hypothetical protein
METGGSDRITWYVDEPTQIALGIAQFGWCCLESFEDRKAEFASYHLPFFFCRSMRRAGLLNFALLMSEMCSWKSIIIIIIVIIIKMN